MISRCPTSQINLRDSDSGLIPAELQVILIS